MPRFHSRPFQSTWNGGNAAHLNFFSAIQLHNVEKRIPNPFTRLDQGTYLHERPEKDVYQLLIDSLRWRELDDIRYRVKILACSIHSGYPSSIVPFRLYLDNAATRPNLLPPWWNAEKRKECEVFGERGAWNDLRCRVEKPQLIDYYGDKDICLQLEMLAEIVFGNGSLGYSRTRICQNMMQEEQGGEADRKGASTMKLVLR
jgi:splicing suppressor protein 51